MEMLKLSKIRHSLHTDTDLTNTELNNVPSASISTEGNLGEIVCYGINWKDLSIASNGVPVKLESIPESRYHKVGMFFVCGTCGKVFWEGSHFENIVSNFSDVLAMH